LKQFLQSIFSKEEHQHISESIERAHSLYITAKSIFPKTGKRKKELEKGDDVACDETEYPTESEHDETIVACLNFALMDKCGFFINWLAVSKEVISNRKYGVAMEVASVDQLWGRRHFGLFLIRVANLAVLTNLKLEKGRV
jgi:hypothetical protein